MGNEASSVHIHSALTAEDLKALRSTFPGGGNSLEVRWQERFEFFMVYHTGYKVRFHLKTIESTIDLIILQLMTTVSEFDWRK